jgi:protein-S-isoprenylcysteine O-methyltransferase Ste14
MTCDQPTTSPANEASSCASPRAPWVPGPPRLLLFALVAMVLLNLVVPVATFPLAMRLAGLVPLALGVALNLLADRDMRRAGTTVKPRLPSTALVTSGVFAVTRNPMYLGMGLLLLGLWLLLGSLTPGLPVVLFVLTIDLAFVRPEEEKLTKAFGASFEAYRARVPRWV